MMLDRQLWQQSGHWEKYAEHMFTTASENREYAIKPMNCPGHVQIFNQGLKSYRDLPLRLAEFGCCHRNEPSGALHGLMRVRAFTQDDAHIFCTEAQIQAEVSGCIAMVYDTYATFGFQRVKVKLSTRPEKRIGTDATWDRAEQALMEALQSHQLAFNDEIRVSQVRLIDKDGDQVGVVSIHEALAKARDSGVDLVEISPNAEPPVCRIMDYGKFLYEKSKAAKEQKKKQKVIQVKEIKCRPGTDEGDYQVKLRSLIRFLEEGDKAKITLRFRGREMAPQQIGLGMLNRIKDDLSLLAVVESFPSRIEGRQMIMVLAPKKQ
jgi:translation initiation factor IF-3